MAMAVAVAVALVLAARSVLEVLQHPIPPDDRSDPHAAHGFLLYQPYVTSSSELGSFAGSLRGRGQRLRACRHQTLRREGLQVDVPLPPTPTREHAPQRNERHAER